MHALPLASDDAPPKAAARTAALSTVSGGLTPDGKVVLNRAGVSELRRLPTVGAKRAEAIVALRERLGGFRRPSDLLRVRGIGTRTLERMLPLLVLDPPANAAPASSPADVTAESP
jgi:competence protein ComEA